MEIAGRRKKRAFRLKWPTHKENKSNAALCISLFPFSRSFSSAFVVVRFCVVLFYFVLFELNFCCALSWLRTVSALSFVQYVWDGRKLQVPSFCREQCQPIRIEMKPATQQCHVNFTRIDHVHYMTIRKYANECVRTNLDLFANLLYLMML